MNEIRKPVVGFEGLYEISNIGRLRSFHTGPGSKPPGTIMSLTHTRGYPSRNISKNKKQYCKKIHRLVAEAFIPNPENKPQVNHINGDISDNRVENLERVTSSENVMHSHRKLGTRHKNHLYVIGIAKRGTARGLLDVLKRTSVNLENVKKAKNVKAPAIEERVPITGYEGYYEVSNLGRVKSLERITIQGVKVGGNILKNTYDKGYERVGLYIDGRPKVVLVHRLVAQAFLPNPDNLPFVNHINAVRNVNHVNNLERCTPDYNNKYHMCHIRNNRGMNLDPGLNKIAINQLTMDGEFIRERSSISEARKNVCKGNISWACSGKIDSVGGYKRSYAD